MRRDSWTDRQPSTSEQLVKLSLYWIGSTFEPDVKVANNKYWFLE